MKRKLHRTNLPLFIARIILCCSFPLLLNCNSNTGFQRYTSIIDGWQHSKPLQSKANTITYSKELWIDYQHDKIYSLQLAPTSNLIQARLNQTEITGTYTKHNEMHFNITEHLKEQNNIELTYKSETDFGATIHCVNKLYIPEIYLEYNDSGQALVEVKIKNAYNTEKQGVLEYTLFTDEKKLQTKETPVFIAGNAENLYRQHLNIGKQIDDLKVECRLYSDGKLYDINTDDVEVSDIMATVISE